MKKVLIMLFLLTLSACNNSNKLIDEKTQKLNEMASNINNDFNKIKNEVFTLSKKIAELYQNQEEIIKNVDKSKYILSPNGVLFKPKDDGGSAVFVTGVVPVDESVKNAVYLTEPIDKEFKTLCGKYPEIVQVYFNDKNSMNRIYPFFDVLAQYEPKANWTTYNFYFLADEKHNPERKAVWVEEPYVDPAGRGWMISSIAPVYIKDSLIGVPGIDITINEITKRYINDDEDNLKMIIDQSGTIVTAKEKVFNILSFPPLKDHKYIETIKLNTYRKESYNILMNKNEDVRKLGINLLKENKKIVDFKSNGKEYKVISSEITELKWIIIELISL